MIDELLRFFCGANCISPEVYTCFYTLLLTIATAILCLVGWVQLRGIKKISKADFINKFNRDFFNPETRKLIMLLSYDALEFKVAEIKYGENSPSIPFPYFNVKTEVITQFPSDESNMNTVPEKYSSFEIDDILLGYFEEMGCFEKGNLIGISGVYDGFDWYIQLVWNNSTIQQYIKHTRETDPKDYDIYKDFEYIYNKSKVFGEAKSKDQMMSIWKLRWNFSNWILKR